MIITYNDTGVVLTISAFVEMFKKILDDDTSAYEICQHANKFVKIYRVWATDMYKTAVSIDTFIFHKIAGGKVLITDTKNQSTNYIKFCIFRV